MSVTLGKTVFAASLSLWITACGGGGGEGGEVIPRGTEASIITIPAPGEPLPRGVLAYDQITDTASRIYFSGDPSGQALLWESISGSGGLLPGFNLLASEYDPVHGWSTKAVVKTDLAFSDVKFKKDGLNDLHVAWFTPGVGIGARSKVNGAWRGESLLTATGACLDLEANQQRGGAMMIWCESNDLIGRGSISGLSWINQGVLDNAAGDAIEGSEPSFDDVEDSNFVVSWSAIETDTDGVTPVSALHVGVFDGNGNIVTDDTIDRLSDSFTPFNEVFVEGDHRIMVYADILGPSTVLKASVFDGAWSAPASIDSAPGGYASFDVYTLDNGDIMLLSRAMGATLMIHRYAGGVWSEVQKIPNVLSFDGATDENQLWLMYSTATESKGVKIVDGTIEDVFNLHQSASDIGIAKTGTHELMGVWRTGSNAYSVVVDLSL